MKKAFSLIELLISLIIISTIAASFAPVVTKKIKHKQLTLTQGSKITNECSTANCRICAKKGSTEQCLYCEGTCSYGYKYNTKLCKCEKLNCSWGTFLDGNNCSSCLTKYDNCESCNATECLSCKSDYKLKNGYCKKAVTPANQSDCDKFDAIFIPFTSGSQKNAKMLNQGVCMTKRNAGDPNGPSVAFSNITLLVAGNKNSVCPGSSTPCCWSGALTTQTAGTGEGQCSNNPSGVAVGSLYAKYDYPSCKRTVCNFAAAQYACSQYKTERTKAGDWTLPDANLVSHMQTIMNYLEPCANPDGYAGDTKKYSCYGPKFVAASAVSYIQNYKGANGLQLCDGANSGVGGARCYMGSKRCYGSQFSDNNGNAIFACVPSGVWLKDRTAIGMTRGHIDRQSGFLYYHETDTKFYRGSYNVGTALSVRCVLTSFLED